MTPSSSFSARSDAGLAAEPPASVLDQIEAPAASLAGKAQQETGEVVRSEGGKLRVRLLDRELDVERAASCLVAPEPGDLVLLAFTRQGAFALAVLRQRAGAPTTISAQGDLRVSLPAGKLSVASKDGIHLTSAADVQIVSQELGISVSRARVVAEELVVLGARAIAEVVHTKLQGSTIEGVFERALSRVKRSFRYVEETDSLRAGDIDYKAEANMGLRSQNTVMTAKELIKADAEQIHFG